MPTDFKIEYHYDGGMQNTSRTIILLNGKCSDEGSDEEIPYEYEWENMNISDLEILYKELRKLNAFTLKSKNVGHVDDRGGESMRFTINGKDYNVSDSQSNFITEKDAPAFNKAIELILIYNKKHRVKKKYSQIDFPEKMPEDFAIEYVYNGGSENRTVYLTKENCIDQGIIQGTNFNYSWKNTTITEFEKLYIELLKLNAFSLEYNEVVDNGHKVEETIKYTINGTYYLACNAGKYFIINPDLSAFNKSVELILGYSLKNSRTSTNKN